MKNTNDIINEAAQNLSWFDEESITTENAAIELKKVASIYESKELKNENNFSIYCQSVIRIAKELKN